ncbi:polysaccharide biosynthesis/export family protein, partial [Vibrio fortis]
MKTLIIALICFLTLAVSPVYAEDEFSDAVQVGDLIQVNVPGEESLNRGFQVDKRGRITLPEVGAVFVAGYDNEQLQKVVIDALSTTYRDLS